MMANSTVTIPTVKVEGTQGPAEAEILTPQAIEFLGALSANFEAERQRLLAERVTRGEALRQGQLYDFLPETANVRPICKIAERRSQARSIARW
jgi:malate synthase